METTKLTLTSLDCALQHAARGWHVFPCLADKKPAIPSAHPEGDPLKGKCRGECGKLGHGFNDATTDPAKIREMWAKYPGALVGIACEKSGFFALDVDCKNDIDGDRVLFDLITTRGSGQPIASGPLQTTPSGGYHILFTLPAGVKIPNNAGKLGPGLDLRSAGYICTGVLPDGSGYQWLADHGPDSPLTDAPAWMIEIIRNMGERSNQAAAPAPAYKAPSGQDAGEFWLNRYLPLAHDGNRNDTLYRMGLQLNWSDIPQSEAERLALTFAAQKGLPEHEALATLRSAYKTQKREAARLPGMFDRNSHQAAAAPAGRQDAREPDSGPILLTELGNSRRFSRTFAGQALHVKAWGWLLWNRQKWEIDETGRIASLGKRIVDGLFQEAQAALSESQSLAGQLQTAADNERESVKTRYDAAQKRANELLKWALQSQTAQKINAMLTLAESDLPARVADFDANTWALNVQNGIIDLKTGELRTHDPSERITKIAGADYDPAAKCPTWLRFLDRVFDGDQELIDYIQRAVGYSLTGDTSEQVFFFLYGNGRNGKSTFTNVIAALLGDYFHKAQSQTFMLRSGQSNGPTEGVAALVGARFVSASELARGQRLDEQLVKDLTGGGDLVPARRLYKSEFTFKPALKLWFYGNEKPQVSGTDEGIWRRVKTVPFTVTIPESEVDPGLPDKLAAELPGILAWAVHGCLEWQRQGLGKCKAVEDATQEYRQEEDVIAQFLAECCILGPSKSAMASALHNAFTKWGGGWSMKALSKELKRRGFKSYHERGGNCYSGIGLLESDDPQKPLL